MKQLAGENGKQSTGLGVFSVWLTSTAHGAAASIAFRVCRGMQRTSVRAVGCVWLCLAPSTSAPGPPRLVTGHTNPHNNRGRRPRNDLRLPGAFVEQRPTKLIEIPH